MISLDWYKYSRLPKPDICVTIVYISNVSIININTNLFGDKMTIGNSPVSI